jgi:hypothetical protein
MNTITINGLTITGGRCISVVNGKIIVDGKDVTPDAKDIRIEVTGNVEKLQADACNSITVTGNAENVTTQSGDVHVGGTVGGSVQTMSGDVDCGRSILGSVSTMSGNVRHQRV